MSGQIAFVALVIAALARCVSCYRAGRLPNALISSLAALMYTVCLWVPAVLQSRGELGSKIKSAGVSALPTPSEVDLLAWHWFLELFVVLAAEILAVFVYSRRAPKVPARPVEQWKTIAIVLICIGTVATFAFPAALENRAAEGQGIFVLLRTCLVCGLAITAYYGGFGSRKMWSLLALGTIFLVLENVRSPLFVILIAYAIGLLVRGTIYRRKVVAALLACVFIAVGSASFMSEMRANITRDRGLSASDIFSEMVQDPVVAAYGAGIDTLDGYRFAAKISEFEPARPFDLLSPVTTFIPRSIWQDKPQSISVEVSSKYLGYRSSGQFLSMVGYLRLATGGYASAILLFGIFFFVAAALVQVFRRQIWFAIVVIVVFRMLLGGSSFDIYYGLVLTVIIGGMAVALDVFRYLTRRQDEPLSAKSQIRLSRI